MDDIYYFHGKTIDNIRFTIAGKCSNELILGVSICSLKDRFEKKLGRNKSKGRMLALHPPLRGQVRIPFDKKIKEDRKDLNFFLENVKKFTEFNRKELLNKFHLKN